MDSSSLSGAQFISGKFKGHLEFILQERKCTSCWHSLMSIMSSAGLVMGIAGLPSDIPVVVTANNIATRPSTPLSDIVNLRRRSYVTSEFWLLGLCLACLLPCEIQWPNPNLNMSLWAYVWRCKVLRDATVTREVQLCMAVRREWRLHRWRGSCPCFGGVQQAATRGIGNLLRHLPHGFHALLTRFTLKPSLIMMRRR